MKDETLAKVQEHYDAYAPKYHEQYERNSLFTNEEYPANYFRLQLLLNSFTNKGLKKIFEVGVGEGTPLKTLADAGFDVYGCDLSEKMVEISRRRMRDIGLDADRINWADIQDPTTYAKALRAGPYDGLIAMGVMPHVHNDDMVLDNMAALVRPGGSVFIEFRNKLFSMFTFNRYTLEFVMDDLLKGVSPELKAAVEKELKPRLRMDLPPVRETVPGTDKAGFDAILAKFHNPLEMPEFFERHGFKDIRFMWYHYHPALPLLERKLPELFRREAVKLEHEPSGWRGMFLCSAFVVEAVKA